MLDCALFASQVESLCRRRHWTAEAVEQLADLDEALHDSDRLGELEDGGVGLTDPSFDTPARVEHPVDGERGRFPLLRVIFRGVRDADAGRPGV